MSSIIERASGGGRTLVNTPGRIRELSSEETLSNLSLEALAIVANESAGESLKAAGKAVEHAIRCGRALIAAKSQMNHGEWLPWLKRNFDHSADTAGIWMKLAANSERVRNLGEAPSIRAALQFIAAADDVAATVEPSCEVDVLEGDDEADTAPPADTRSARPASRVNHALAPTTSGSSEGPQRAAEASTGANPVWQQLRFHDEFKRVLERGPAGREKAQKILTSCLHSLAAASSREERQLGLRLVKELIAGWVTKFGVPVVGEEEPATEA